MIISTNVVAISCMVLVALVLVIFFHIYDVRFGELILNKNKKAIKPGLLYRRDSTNVDVIKPTNVEILLSNPRSYVPRNNVTFKSPEVVKLYDDRENKLSKAEIVWADFVLLPKEGLRSKQQNLDPSILKTLNLCSNELLANLSIKLDGKDFEFCKWSLSGTGGKVKIGESFGLLSTQEQGKFQVLGCANVVNNKSFSCDDDRGDNLIQTWKRNLVKGLCEKNAESKVNCFDSRGGSRYCQFENTMMNFKRMRNKIRADGTPSRSWEQGFLSSSCGDTGKENIGYSKMYKPDIDGSSDAVCDYVFNETVLAYSHDNVKAFSHMFSDYLNVQSLLWLSGAAAYAKDVSLLNIDSFRMQQYYGDQPNEYFSYYTKSFRRILRAKDFGTFKVCFKNLIMQPKPEIQFTRDGWKNDLRCSMIGPSSIFQRWNLQMRESFGLLSLSALQTNEIFTILLITKASKLGSSIQFKKNKKSKTIKMKNFEVSSTSAARNLLSIETSVDKSPSAHGIANSGELVLILRELSSELGAKNPAVVFQVVEQDLDLLAFDDQVALVARSSLIIGMHGTGIAISMHMAVGSKYCCGVIEIFPSVIADRERGGKGEGRDRNKGNHSRELSGKEDKSESRFVNLKGHGNMARRMGHQYRRIDLNGIGIEAAVAGDKSGKREGNNKHGRSDVTSEIHSKQIKWPDRKDEGGQFNLAHKSTGSSSRSSTRKLDSVVDTVDMNISRGIADGIKVSDKAKAVIEADGIRVLTGMTPITIASGSIDSSSSVSGAYVPTALLRHTASLMIENILVKPSCFLPNVVKKKI